MVDLEIKEEERTNLVVGIDEDEEEDEANENGGLEEAAAVAAAEMDAMGDGGFRR